MFGKNKIYLQYEQITERYKFKHAWKLRVLGGNSRCQNGISMNFHVAHFLVAVARWLGNVWIVTLYIGL